MVRRADDGQRAEPGLDADAAAQLSPGPGLALPSAGAVRLLSSGSGQRGDPCQPGGAAPTLHKVSARDGTGPGSESDDVLQSDSVFYSLLSVVFY